MLDLIRAAASTPPFGIMKIFVVLLVIVVLGLLIVACLRLPGAAQEPKYVTRDQIPSIVSKLQRTGGDGAFVVFMFVIPGNNDETLPNLQYSIENGRLGFDWVLLAPQNIKDETAVTDFLKRAGYTVSKREMNRVTYLRAEGGGIEQLGANILRDFYRLAAEAKLELITEGFDV